MNTFDLKQLSAVTLPQLSSDVQELADRGPRSESGGELSALVYVLSGSSFAEHLLPRSFIFLLNRLYGANVENLNSQFRRLTAMCAQFVQLYGEGPVSLLRAPARINILGEHIDYVSYLPTAALPFGSREHDMLMLYRGSATDRVRGASTLLEYAPFTFALAEGPALVTSPGNDKADWLTYLYEHPAGASHWSNYVKGAVHFARNEFGSRVSRGFDFLVDSGIPAGGGASSSSTLVVLASAAVRDVNQLSYAPLELARDAARAEWFVGTRGGSMDHITICLAQRDHAVLISYPDQQTRQIGLPGRKFRWVTFFSQPADKGRAVMIEYNERAAVSRIVLPALVEGWKKTQPVRYTAWVSAIRSLETGATGTLDEIETLLHQLPSTLTLTELGRDYPEAFAACARSFPILVAERADRPLQVRARAMHHIGEVRRVKTASQILDHLPLPNGNTEVEQELEASMHLLGALFAESHSSLRDLYEVSTPDVERLIEIVCSDPGVYGAHLMGGGFGGNVLTLTTAENVESLIERVQAEYYEPQKRHGLSEGAVMVSTPGDGLASIKVESVWREAIEDFNSSGPEATTYRAGVNSLLDIIGGDGLCEEVWPVIVAAGKGTRSLASGLVTPKPLAPVLAKPAILHVLQSVRTAFSQTRPPVVIVSPETELQTRAVITEDAACGDVIFVVQPEALGTGDAVLHAFELMQGFQGRALVIWGTQPVIRPATMRRTLKLSALFPEFEMVLPTAYKQWPYAPLLRDERGNVQSARETHLENADPVHFGESNIGMFILKNESMFKALIDLNGRHWGEAERRYRRPSGELGFPNELINYFAARETGVFACPIADSREEQGIKNLEDVARCEQFISELAGQDDPRNNTK